MAVEEIDVLISREQTDHLTLQYIVTGNLENVLFSPKIPQSRGDKLWQHTCFEVFLRASNQTPYYEFNFAPSTQWAAYFFLDYRIVGGNTKEMNAPRIDSQLKTQSYQMTVRLDLTPLPNLPSNTSWQFGASSVIEEINGSKSYWALTHPPGKPDFHHSDCFALELGAEARI